MMTILRRTWNTINTIDSLRYGTIDFRFKSEHLEVPYAIGCVYTLLLNKKKKGKMLHCIFYRFLLFAFISVFIGLEVVTAKVSKGEPSGYFSLINFDNDSFSKSYWTDLVVKSTAVSAGGNALASLSSPFRRNVEEKEGCPEQEGGKGELSQGWELQTGYRVDSPCSRQSVPQVNSLKHTLNSALWNAFIEQ